MVIIVNVLCDRPRSTTGQEHFGIALLSHSVWVKAAAVCWRCVNRSLHSDIAVLSADRHRILAPGEGDGWLAFPYPGRSMMTVCVT
jgi:hypothetical protein